MKEDNAAVMRGLILYITALVLSAVLLPVGFVYQLISSLLKATNDYLFTIAKSIDQLGNVVCQGLFDLLLITKKSTSKFGCEDETISSVLGNNKKAATLTILGKMLTYLLNKIEKNHVENAIESTEKMKRLK